MSNDSVSRATTGAPLPTGAVLATSLFVFSTASVPSLTAFDEVDRIHAPAIDPEMATASDRLQSDLDSPEFLGPAAAGRITPLLGTLVDPKASLRERIALLAESHDRGATTPPSPDAVDDALRFLDLLPADSPLPHVSVADDGEINFFRRAHGLYLDVGFFGDGQIHYYARVEQQGIDVDGSEPFTGRSLPRDLVIPLTVA